MIPVELEGSPSIDAADVKLFSNFHKQSHVDLCAFSQNVSENRVRTEAEYKTKVSRTHDLWSPKLVGEGVLQLDSSSPESLSRMCLHLSPLRPKWGPLAERVLAEV